MTPEASCSDIALALNHEPEAKILGIITVTRISFVVGTASTQLCG